MLFPSVRSPEIICGRAPNAPAVEVTITSAFLLFSRVTAFVMFVEPSDWYVSSATILPPSWVNRALNALTTSRK